MHRAREPKLTKVHFAHAQSPGRAIGGAAVAIGGVADVAVGRGAWHPKQSVRRAKLEVWHWLQTQSPNGKGAVACPGTVGFGALQMGLKQRSRAAKLMAPHLGQGQSPGLASPWGGVAVATVAAGGGAPLDVPALGR